jgi:hypothetical protein
VVFSWIGDSLLGTLGLGETRKGLKFLKEKIDAESLRLYTLYFILDTSIDFN